MTWLNIYSLGGFAAVLALAWLTSSNRGGVRWRTVGVGCLGLALIGSIVFWFAPFRTVLLLINSAVNAAVAASAEGSRFMFGPLASGTGEGSIGFILAFQVLPAVIFFSVITAWLYHVGVLPAIVRWTALVVHRSFGLSGAEALSTASNAFLGIESALVVRPFLASMTRSELMMVMTAGLSSIASTVLAMYVSFLQSTFPYIAGHLISASVISIPAAVIISKMVVPEDGIPATMGRVPASVGYSETRNWMGSIIWGANEGVKLAVGIGALLIGMLGLVALIDVLLGETTAWLGTRLLGSEARLSLQLVLEWCAYPLVLCLGLEPREWSMAARLIGERWILTEVVAYQDLAVLASSGQISPRALMVLSYALCGFTHVASVAIFVGGISALVPSRRDDLAALAWRSLWAASLSTILTGATAGIFYYGQAGLIG
jgi:concentrative nucleoside transporter, CNT family